MKKIAILLLIVALVAMLSMFMITTAWLLSVENTIGTTDVNVTALQPRCKPGVRYGIGIIHGNKTMYFAV